jgi:hypothetical protein
MPGRALGCVQGRATAVAHEDARAKAGAHVIARHWLALTLRSDSAVACEFACRPGLPAPAQPLVLRPISWRP